MIGLPASLPTRRSCVCDILALKFRGLTSGDLFPSFPVAVSRRNKSSEMRFLVTIKAPKEAYLKKVAGNVMPRGFEQI